jgi:hypothetical protein
MKTSKIRLFAFAFFLFVSTSARSGQIPKDAHGAPSVSSSMVVPTSQRDALRPTKVSQKNARKTESITSEAGLNIPQWGIAIDAFFDPRLTDLVPGYHVVNIVLTNRRGGPLLLDPVQDRWVIVDNAGKKHVARNHGRQLKNGAWESLPDVLKKKLDYPTSVKPGNFVTIDVFVPNRVDLTNFREVTWKSYALSKEFNIFTNYEDTLNVGDANDDKQQEIPRAASIQTYSDSDYLKTRDEILNPTTTQKWDDQEKQAEQRESRTFDPSFDDAIIIR